MFVVVVGRVAMRVIVVLDRVVVVVRGVTLACGRGHVLHARAVLSSLKARCARRGRRALATLETVPEKFSIPTPLEAPELSRLVLRKPDCASRA